MEITTKVTDDNWRTATGRSSPRPQSTIRWIVHDQTVPVAGIEVSRRADGKHFVFVSGSDELARRLLLDVAVAKVSGTLHATCAHDDPLSCSFTEAGFEIALTEQVFEVAFSSAMAAVERAWVPTAHTIMSAESVDRRSLLDLDNRLRRLVPGLDGWSWEQQAFDAEFADAPPYDPAAYLVAQDGRTGALVGLIRFWRNPSGPRLGMIAVLPSHRTTTIGPALLKAALPVAGAWGSPHFVTETAITNRHVHHRLLSIGARRISGFDVLRRELPR